MKRHHWKNFDRRKEYGLDKNENCDTYLRKFIDSNFYRKLNDKHIAEYPCTANAYKDMCDLYSCDDSHIFLTPGCEQGIKSVLEIYSTNPTNKLTYFQPTFGMVPVYADYYRYNREVIDYKYTTGKFMVSIPTEGDVLYVADPDNPTGSTIEVKGTRKIEQLCKNFKAVILDKAYATINEVKSLIPLTAEYSNLYILHTFSKLYSAAGLRIGCIISNKSNIDNLYGYRPMYELNSIACQYINFVKHNYMTFENSVNNLHESKRYIESQFNIITTVVPSNGNFVIAEKSDKLLAVLGNDIDYREINVNEHKFIRVTVPDLNLAKKLFHINEIWGNKR